LPPTDSAAKASTTISLRAIIVLAIVAFVVLAIDQLTKYLVLQNLELGVTVPFIGELLQFHLVKNPGAAFSIGIGATWIFSIIASAVVVVIVVFSRRIRSIAWAVLFGMLLGGAVGNLTDRLFREPSFGQGHVIDFLQLYAFPAIFNVADIAVVSSMGLFIILTMRGIRLDGTRMTKDATTTEGAA
jgi:signal peptidase II